MALMSEKNAGTCANLAAMVLVAALIAQMYPVKDNYPEGMIAPLSKAEEFGNCAKPSGNEVNQVCTFPDLKDTVVIMVNGTRFAYCGVPAEMIDRLRTDAEPGKIFTNEIRDDVTGGKYTCKGKR